VGRRQPGRTLLVRTTSIPVFIVDAVGVLLRLFLFLILLVVVTLLQPLLGFVPILAHLHSVHQCSLRPRPPPSTPTETAR
jgi:hypothetical protein